MPVAENPLVIRKALSLVLLLTAIPFAAHAQSGRWGTRGISRQFLLDGTRLFVADGRGVTLYDVSDLANINPRFTAETFDESSGVVPMSGGRIAVLTHGGIAGFDVAPNGVMTQTLAYQEHNLTTLASNGTLLAAARGNDNTVLVWAPGADGLETVRQYAMHGRITALIFKGNYLFVAVQREAIYVFDTNGGASPVAVLPENADDFALVGDTLYAAANISGVTTFDVSDPAAAHVTDRMRLGESVPTRIAANATRVVTFEEPDIVHVFDATHLPLTEVTTFHDAAEVLAANATTLFVSGNMYDKFHNATATGVPVRAYDLATARVMGERRDLAGPLSGVAISANGSIAYVMDPPFFRVIDVSTTAAPHEIASLQLDHIEDQVKVRGNRVILYGRGDVDIIDVSDPHHPRYVGVFHSFGPWPSRAAIARDTVVEGNPGSGFHVIDYTSYPQPTQISGLKGHYFEIVGRDDYAIIFTQTGWASVDLSDRMNAQLGAQGNLGVVQADIGDATASHPELLAVHALDGLQLFTLANPLAPVAAGRLPLDPDGVIAADGDTIWIVTANGVNAVDVTDPHRPSMSATTLHAIAPMQAAASHGKVVIADRYTLRVFGANTPPIAAAGPSRRRAAGR